MARPRAADFPRPRAAVSATVLRSVFSEAASRNVRYCSGLVQGAALFDQAASGLHKFSNVTFMGLWCPGSNPAGAYHHPFYEMPELLTPMGLASIAPSLTTFRLPL